MKKLLNPAWLLIINTVPVLILASLLGVQYTIIKSSLSPENIFLCSIFASALFILSCSTLVYSLIQTIRKKPLSIYYGFFTLVLHLAFLYIYCNYLSDMIPMRTPQWVLGDDIIMYVGTFLMPTLAHAVMIIVMWLTPEDRKHKAGYNFIGALLIPLSWYLFSQLLLPFWKILDYGYNVHVMILLAVASIIVFLFLLIRTIYIIAIQKNSFFTKYPLVWKIPVAVVFPVVGLLLNNGYFFGGMSSVFGNFSSIWFYILALINGLLICLPRFPNKILRLAVFTGKSILFAYTFYFFLVFLPYLPLSIVLILWAGAGFLMLAPLIVFVVHLQEISEDILYLKKFFSSKILYSISIVGFAALPAFIVIHYVQDKHVLHTALNYVYSPNYEEQVEIDRSSLKQTLETLQDHKDRSRFFQQGSQTPYLSSLFKWIVFDNMTLSDQKIHTLENVFWGTTSFNLLTPIIADNKTVKVTDIKTKSTYHPKSSSWISTMDIELTNTNQEGWQSEYSTTLDLPEGCWISDYYLYIGDRKEKGLLAEKKAAMWVYDQIVSTRRDPGILYYLTGNKVALRVFPFAAKEVRKTGIEFLHKEPIQLTIDGQSVQLGNNAESQSSEGLTINEQIFYVSAVEKNKLPLVERQPYYHFIVDVSKDKEKLQTEYIKRIEHLLSQQIISDDKARISFTNSYTHTIPLGKNLEDALHHQNYAGGFYLEHAIKSILTEHYLHPTDSYPIITVLTDSLPNAILDKDFASLKFTSPENNSFYVLTTEGILEPHDLFHSPVVVSSDSNSFPFQNQKVYAWPNENNPSAYLPIDNQPSIVLKGIINAEHPGGEWKEKNISAALSLRGAGMSHALYPYTSDKDWLDVVKQSFKTKILTPYTSYIVVETEVQKQMILKKQKETLAGSQSMDLGEEAQRMSEPELIVVGILFILYLGYRQRRKNKYILSH